MNRPAISLRTLGLCSLVVVLALSVHRVGDYRLGEVAAAPVGDLQDQLVSALKTQRPVDLEFITRVVTLVEEDRLPRSLVLSTLQWARPKTPRPFPYFERALRVRAARIGVEL